MGVQPTRINLRKVDGSPRNQVTYYLIEAVVLNKTIQIAQVYDIDLAKEFTDLVQAQIGGEIHDTTDVP
jgi:hypothetical protein